MNNVKRFEIGKTYATSSICDSNCIIAVKVVRRTASTVTVAVAACLAVAAAQGVLFLIP